MKMYYLNSGEYLLFKDAPCRILQRIKNDFRDDYALIEMDPPLPAGIYGSKKISRLVVAPAFQGETLFPFSNDDIGVAIFVVKDFKKIIGERCDTDNLIFIDKGSIYSTPRKNK